MRLEKGEKVLKVYYHHYFPFVIRLAKVFLATLPFYFLLYLFRDSFEFRTVFWAHIIIVLLFSLVTVYVTLVYWLDRMVVTNLRVVFIDWKYLTVKAEYETELKDVQDITSIEKGFIALIPIFDYGSVIIKTASSAPTIDFPEAPDPDGIKKFLNSLILHDR